MAADFEDRAQVRMAIQGRVVLPAGDDGQAFLCACGGDLDTHQPCVEEPSQLLGQCLECGGVVWLLEREEAPGQWVALELPSRDTLVPA